MRLLIVLLFTIINLFGASSEQIDKYMSLSSATEKILLVENKLGKVQKIMGIEERYDLAKVEIRFKKRIAELLSDDEMKEILENYKNLLYSRLIQELHREDTDPTTSANIEKYYNQLKDNKDQDERLKITKEITDNILKDDILSKVFDQVSMPFMKLGDDQGEDKIKEIKRSYIKHTKYRAEKVINYRLQDLSIEDLKNLAKFTKKSSVYNEQKALTEATVYSIEEYLNFIVKFYKK